MIIYNHNIYKDFYIEKDNSFVKMASNNDLEVTKNDFKKIEKEFEKLKVQYTKLNEKMNRILRDQKQMKIYRK